MVSDIKLGRFSIGNVTGIKYGLLSYMSKQIGKERMYFYPEMEKVQV